LAGIVLVLANASGQYVFMTSDSPAPKSPRISQRRLRAIVERSRMLDASVETLHRERYSARNFLGKCKADHDRAVADGLPSQLLVAPRDSVAAAEAELRRVESRLAEARAVAGPAGQLARACLELAEASGQLPADLSSGAERSTTTEVDR
jgi:hypothetical protein